MGCEELVAFPVKSLIISLEDTELLGPLRFEPLLPPDSPPSDGDSGGDDGVEAPARELADSPVRTAAVLVSGLQTSSKCAIKGGRVGRARSARSLEATNGGGCRGDRLGLEGWLVFASANFGPWKVPGAWLTWLELPGRNLEARSGP